MATTAIMYAPAPNDSGRSFLVRSGNSGRVSEYLFESSVRVIGDGDINSVLEIAKAVPNQWVNVIPTIPQARHTHRSARYTSIVQ
jgi:hypothetical protein